MAPWKDTIEARIMFLEGDSRLTLNRLKMGRIHFAFLDGAHSYQDVMAEINLIHRWQEAGDVIVFDDYNIVSYPGLVKAVKEACKAYNYSINIIRSNRDRDYVIAHKQK